LAMAKVPKVSKSKLSKVGGGLAALPLPEPKNLNRGTDWVDPEELFEFLFPTGVYHPFSTSRLYVFADYGPVLVNGRLRSGYKGQHLVTDQELKDMTSEMIKEDILKIYVGDQVLSQRDQDEVIQQADSKFKSIPNYTKGEILELLRTVPRNEEGHYNFHELQRIVQQNRAIELRERKKMYPDVVVKGGLKTSVFNKLQKPRTTRKLRDSEMFMRTNRMLSNNCCKVTEADTQQDPNIVNNSRLLREEFEPSQIDPDFPRWTSQPSGANKGSFVKPHQKWTSQYTD